MLNNIHMLVIYVFFIKSAYVFCHFMRLLNDLLYIVYSLHFLTSSMLSILQSGFSCIYIYTVFGGKEWVSTIRIFDTRNAIINTKLTFSTCHPK